MAEGTFAAAINCIDGRAQAPVTEWLRARYGVDYVDMVTVPGPDAALFYLGAAEMAMLRDAVAVSVNAHHSRVIAVAGHYGCAANPASEADHKEAIARAVDVVAAWGLPATVVGLWVNEQWQAELIKPLGAGADAPAR